MSKRRVLWSWKDQQREVKKAWNETAPTFDEYFDILEKSLTKDHPSLLTSHLANCGTDIARRGMVQIFDGKPAGWSDIHTAWRYHSWQVQVTVSEGKYSWEDLMPDAARVLAAAIALREKKYAQWCGGAMLKNHRDPAIDYDPFQAFMVVLFARWTGKSGELKGWKENLGPYQAVLDDWDDDLSAAIVGIADFHCKHSKHLGEGVFWRHPDTAFPAEILALQAVRADLGLPTPAIAHPLLDQPLARLPDQLPKPKLDKWLDRVVKRCQQLDPKIKDVQRTFWNS